MAKTVKFRTELVESTTGSGWHFLLVEKKIERKFGFEGKFKRVVCAINGGEAFQCALMPWGEMFYIIVNKQKRDAVGIVAGDMVNVDLVKDESKYGLPMPEEFAEVLRQDPEGNRLFHELTAGKQRSLIHTVITVKNIDKRIHTALIVVEHLKKNDGTVNGDQLYEKLKRPLF
jgi:hypothetical protein